MPIKQTPLGFVAIAKDGTNLGVFPSRATAQAAIDNYERTGKKPGDKKKK